MLNVRISAATELQSSLAQVTGPPPLVLVVEYWRGFQTAICQLSDSASASTNAGC